MVIELVKIVSVSLGVLLNFEVGRRCLDLKFGKDFTLFHRQFCALVYFIFIDGKMTELYSLQFISYLATGHPGSPLCYPYQKESQPAKEDVRSYPFFLAVIHRSQLKGGLQGPEGILYIHQLLVSKRYVFT